MSISIIGSSGFIGQNLLKSFANAKCISLRSKDWEKKIDDTDVIINLVGKAHDHKGIATEKDFFDVNVELIKDIFNAFLKSNASLLIHISSIATVEEFHREEILSETTQCFPQSFYGKSKKAAEDWLMSQTLPENKQIIILRPPMVHGEGDKGSLGLLYKFISKGIPYPLANFDNQRSFISIDNFCFFIEQIIVNRQNVESGIYHIADDETVSTKELISIIEEIENKNVINLNIPKFLVKWMAKIGDVIPFPLNTKRLRKMTGNLIVSNQKIKRALKINELPLSSEAGLKKTLKSFSNKQ